MVAGAWGWQHHPRPKLLLFVSWLGTGGDSVPHTVPSGGGRGAPPLQLGLISGFSLYNNNNYYFLWFGFFNKAFSPSPASSAVGGSRHPVSPWRFWDSALMGVLSAIKKVIWEDTLEVTWVMS